jgi:predicted phosphoribosyltransferase
MTGPLVFRDRMAAAELLAERLQRRLEACSPHERAERPLVLGVPRGAVPMANAVAQKIGGDLDIVLVHKVGCPGHEEFAVGSVTEDGDVFLGEGAKRLGLSEPDLEKSALREIEELRRRRNLFTPGRGPVEPKGRVVVIVDDGIATGATMTAAVRSLKERQPARIIVATPVASADAVERLTREGAEVIVLSVPQVFFSVSQFYDDFAQVEDEEVATVLRAAFAAKKRRERSPATSSVDPRLR